jgi:hypothetical protein
MNSNFIAVVAIAAAFAMPTIARPVQATIHATHGATTHSTHGALAHSTHGATVSHGGAALTKTH